MKAKRFIAALVCTASVVVGTVSVNAAERANHVHVLGPEQIESVIYSYEDATHHRPTYCKVQYCLDYNKCGWKKDTVEVGEKEPHSWSQAYDSGHQGEEYHAYRLECGGCGCSTTVYIICNYNWTGRHNTPW